MEAETVISSNKVLQNPVRFTGLVNGREVTAEIIAEVAHPVHFVCRVTFEGDKTIDFYSWDEHPLWYTKNAADKKYISAAIPYLNKYRRYRS